MSESIPDDLMDVSEYLLVPLIFEFIQSQNESLNDHAEGFWTKQVLKAFVQVCRFHEVMKFSLVAILTVSSIFDMRQCLSTGKVSMPTDG